MQKFELNLSSSGHAGARDIERHCNILLCCSKAPRAIWHQIVRSFCMCRVPSEFPSLSRHLIPQVCLFANIFLQPWSIIHIEKQVFGTFRGRARPQNLDRINTAGTPSVHIHGNCKQDTKNAISRVLGPGSRI